MEQDTVTAGNCEEPQERQARNSGPLPLPVSQPLDSCHVELAIARHFNYRQNIIVPNVFWGLGLSYEADMVVLRPSGWAIEIEIKVSAADIKRDLYKRHFAHCSPLFRQLWFAVPEALADNGHIPTKAGVLGVKLSGNQYWVTAKRPPTPNRAARRWTEPERLKLMQLGLMRIWGLKEALDAAKMKNRRRAG